MSGLPAGDPVVAISGGESHTCAATQGGNLWCWGHNGFGQLGNNSTSNSSMPVQVLGLTSGVQAVAAGDVDYVESTGEGDWLEFATGHFYGLTTHARGGLFGRVPQGEARRRGGVSAGLGDGVTARGRS